MGAGVLLLLMLFGLSALVGLIGYLLVNKFGSEQPTREAEIVFIPQDVLRRRARNWAIAASVSLILYGLLKGFGHSAFVAMNGISGFGNVPGLVTSTTISGNWFFFLCTLSLATYFVAAGALRLLGKQFALWLAVPAVAFDLLISFLVAMERFGPSARGGGLVFFLAACSIPMVVTTLLAVAINTQLLVGLKVKMDERSSTAYTAR